MARIYILTLIGLCLLSGCTTPENPHKAVDGKRAYSYLLEQCKMGPRFPGSGGHERVIEYLYSHMLERADSVRLETFTGIDSAGKKLELTNIVAVFKPQLESRMLLCCHFDTRPISDEAKMESDRSIPVPGANDGASGAAVLMEVANILNLHEPPIGVDMVFFDGEDNPDKMLLGSQEFASRHPEYRPLYGVLVDMVGDKDLLITKERYSNMIAPEVVSRVWRAAEALGYGHIFVQEVGAPIIDDHIPLLKSGIRCIDVIDFDYPYWHTPDDTPDKCSANSLEIVTEVLVSLIFEVH